MTKGNVFKKGTPQHTTLYQNAGNGYTALYQILTPDHPTLSRFLSLLVCNPPSQITTETVAQYYLHYIDFMGLQGFLEENRSTLNSPSELDKFFQGCLIHRKFIVSLEENVSPMIRASNGNLPRVLLLPLSHNICLS